MGGPTQGQSHRRRWGRHGPTCCPRAQAQSGPVRSPRNCHKRRQQQTNDFHAQAATLVRPMAGPTYELLPATMRDKQGPQRMAFSLALAPSNCVKNGSICPDFALRTAGGRLNNYRVLVCSRCCRADPLARCHGRGHLGTLRPKQPQFFLKWLFLPNFLGLAAESTACHFTQTT